MRPGLHALADFHAENRPRERDSRSGRSSRPWCDEFKDKKFICGPSGGIVGLVLPGGLEKASPLSRRGAGTHRCGDRPARREQDLADPVLIHPDSDAVLVAHDFGLQDRPLHRPGDVPEVFPGSQQARVRRLHRDFGKKVILHSCGNVNSYLDFFVEIGIDAYQSIQPTAGMDICGLKKSHGAGSPSGAASRWRTWWPGPRTRCGGT